jgi:hypothetical protein
MIGSVFIGGLPRRQPQRWLSALIKHETCKMIANHHIAAYQIETLHSANIGSGY